jgi:predicted nuclease with TOPRIM domain
MPATHKKVISFSEYKEMSDEIKGYFKPEFERIHDRFDALESKFQTKFDAIDDRFDSLKNELDTKFGALDEKFKFILGLCGAILIAVIISIITTALK